MCKLQSPLAFVYYLLFIITGLIKDCSWSKNRLSKFVILYFATYGFKQQFDIFLPLRMNESYKLILYPINWDRYFLACCRQTFASFCSILYLDLSTLTHPQGAKKGECRETWPHRKKKNFTPGYRFTYVINNTVLSVFRLVFWPIHSSFLSLGVNKELTS